MAALLGGPVSRAAGWPEGLCLSSAEAVGAVASRQIVEPALAIRRARRAVPDAEVLRATLCHDGDGLVYRIILLSRAGRVARVLVEAPSGEVRWVQ